MLKLKLSDPEANRRVNVRQQIRSLARSSSRPFRYMKLHEVLSQTIKYSINDT
jgi:hypothetical protein